MVDDKLSIKKEYHRTNDIQPEFDLATFPTLSPTSMKLMKLIFDKEVTIDTLVNTVQKDVNLSVEVIRVANSPRYRTNSPIDSVGKAIVYLGLDTIKNIVLSISVTGTMKDILPEKCFAYVLSHSLATASAAQILSQHTTGVNSETAFLVGLFLNMGFFVCASLYPDEFVHLVEESSDKGIPLKVVIKEKLAIDINDLSFQIAKKWELPSIILENISCHAVIEKKLIDPTLEIAPFIIVSYLSLLASNVYFGSSTIVNITLFKSNVVLLLGKSNALAAEILNSLSDEFNDAIETLGLKLPKQKGFIDMLKNSNTQLLQINRTHEAMYRALYAQTDKLCKIEKELHKKNKILSKLVTVDPLTSLYNRRFAVKNLERLFSESRRYNNPLSVIMMDIDLFKKPNEIYGQQAGDEILVHIARCLKFIFRTTDICARYGGEEFLVLLPQTEFSNALIAAEKIRAQIEKHDFTLNSITPAISTQVTISIGVSSFSAEKDSAAAILNECELNLIKAKKEGRNCIRPLLS